ncbi:MAG: DUF368 domain-containing protein [Candidatus Methanomethylophilaceae archaeon]|nr:DUF368 domain-containing protein [Candidatus Methanomethylophilaceae archaeon]
MVLKPLKDILVGALVGLVSMLPGASGATIAVIFGIYERLVSDLADIRHRLLKDLKFIILIFIGIVLGMMVCAFGLEFLMDHIEVPTMFFFAALIVAQIPDIMKLGDDGEPLSKWNIATFVVGFVIMIAFLFLGDGNDVELEGITGTVLMVLVGIILAVSKLAPGVSGSTVLLALGLYAPFMHALTDMDIGYLLPILIGLVIGVLGFSKIVDHCMRNHKKSTYVMILGLTAGSVITVSVQAIMKLSGTEMIAMSIAGIVIGLLLGIGLSKVASSYAKETISEKV